MVTATCDRCGNGEANVAMWDDNVLCGRIDAICEDCYEDGHRIRRPIEPPYDENGELYWHIRLVECPLCGGTHEVNLGDTIKVCPRRSAEDASHEERVFDVTEAIIVEDGF